MIDLFYEGRENNITTYPDDTAPYSCATDTFTVISELQAISKKKKIIIIIIVLAIIIWKPIKINITYYLVLVVSINGIEITITNF